MSLATRSSPSGFAGCQRGKEHSQQGNHHPGIDPAAPAFRGNGFFIEQIGAGALDKSKRRHRDHGFSQPDQHMHPQHRRDDDLQT